MKYFSRMTYICVLILSLMAWIPSAQVSAANSRAANPVPLVLADDNIAAEQDALRAKVTYLKAWAADTYKLLKQKATEEEATDLYSECEDIERRIAILYYDIDNISTMADVYDCQAKATDCEVRLRDLQDEIEAFEGSNIFTATTIEGVEMTFKIISEEEKTVQVGKGIWESRAVDKTTEGEITIPAKVESYKVVAISDYAFEGCVSLTKVNIPEGVVSIGEQGFYDCTSLRSIHIPISLTSIGYVAFAGCANVESITVADGNPTFSAPNGCNTLIKYGYDLFRGCRNSVVPEGVETMENCSFNGVTGMTSITLPQSLRWVGGWAFSGCPDLQHINIPSQVQGIGYMAFYNCPSLTEITLPASVQSIDRYAFAGSYNLLNIKVLMAEPFNINDNVFICWGDFDSDYLYNNATFRVPKGTKALYQTTEYWNKFQNIVEMGEEVELGLCPDNNHPHMIDLGLPSGTKWACCNVGANRPEEYGRYYAWGEIDEREEYSFNTYKWCDGSASTLTKYNNDESYGIVDNKSILEQDDDVATFSWGTQWKMPTSEQCAELMNQCTTEWITVNGIHGVKALGPNGNSIFLPAAGTIWNTSKNYEGEGVFCWSSTPNPTTSYCADELCFVKRELGITTDHFSRYAGQSVRPVISKGALITSVSQLSSPFTEPTEGSLAALIDNNSNTFWHSIWTTGEVEGGLHYFQVEMPDMSNIDYVKFQFTRRNIENDQTVLWGVYGTNDFDASKEACTKLGEFSTPFSSTTETLTSEAFRHNGFKYLRFYSEIQEGWAYSARGYFHIAEFQLYPAEGSVEFERQLMATKNIDDVTYSVYKKILSKDDYHVNADGTSYYRTEICLDITKNGSTHTYTIDNNLYMDEQPTGMMPCMMFDLGTQTMYVFCLSKNEEVNYGMEGHVYVSSMRSVSFEKEIVFSDQNWGWWASFAGLSGGCPQLLHFSFAGYNKMTSVRKSDGSWITAYDEHIYPDDYETLWKERSLILIVTDGGQDLNLSQYEAALEVIEPNAKFRIFTQSNGTTEGTKKYYLTADGYLTDSEDEAYLFTFGRTEGDELFVSPGWKLDIPFSNPHLTNGATGDLPLHGHIRTDYYNGFRDNWEGQVWYKKGDRYAVRSTNSVSSEWGADTYWTVLDSDGNGLPEAEYSLTPNFVWQLEEDQNYIRVALNLIYDGEVIATIPSIQEIGSTIVTPSDFENGLVTLFCDVDTITADTHEANFTAVWNGLFEFSTSYDTANWYNMTIRSNYYVGMDETEPYFPSAEKELWDASNQWAFMGNPYNLIIINRAAGSGQSLMQDDFNVVMRDGEFIWEPFGNYDGFVIRPAGGGSDEWVNQNGGKEGPLQFWVDTYGRYDDGSTFRILEIPDKSVYDELLASAVAQAASVEGLIPRAANEALLAVVAANNHEYTSTTQYNAAINSINSATGLYASTEMREAYSRYLALAQDFETVLETEGLEEREEGALAAYQQAMTLANELVEVTTSTDALVEAATDAKATMREALLNLLAAVAPVDGHPLDITFLLENPDFEEGGEPMMGILPGWMCTFVKGETATNIGYMPNAYNSNGVSSAVGDTYVNGSVRIQHFMEAWQDNSGSRVIGDGKLYQTLSGLPVGWYRLTTDVIAVNQYDSSKNPIAGAYIYISSGQIETTTEIYTGNGLPEHFEVDFINDHAESLDFGLKTLSSTANWIAADNFYIYYVSELKESPGVASLKETLALYEDVTFGPCNRGVLSAFTAEREHAIEMTETNIYSLAHSSECLEEKTILQNKYNDVLASVAAYESYQQSVNKVLARLNSVQDANSPLALSLTDLADELQQGINDGNAVADRYQNIDNQISDIVNYWKFHFSESDLAILREALQQMGNQPSWENRWNLNAEQLSLDGITNTEGRVTAVQLNGRGLTGSVPTALFALEKTSSFNLSGNKLSSIQGTVPQGKTLNIRNQQLDQVINVNIGKNDASLVLSQLPSILCYQNSAGGATSHFAFNVISEDYSFTLSENNGTLQVTSRSSYIYQGEKNAVMACTSTYGDATGSTLNLRFMFDDGDANFDGSLNVLDLQTSINYIMEKYQSRPYNFTAANLWKDDIINVQDIICQVNLLMNMEQAEAEGSVKRKVTGKESSAEVCLFIKDGKLMLSTETPVAAFDITLQGVNSLKVSPDLTQTGITCTTKRGKTGVRIIGYSLADAVIPAGVNTLATLSGTASTSVLEAMLSDSEANAISIRYDGLVTGVSSVNQPVPDAIYDMQGRKVQRPTSKGLYIQNGRKFVKK